LIFDAAAAAGKIHPEMTRADAEALLPPKPLAPVTALAWIEPPLSSVQIS